jgi:nucleolar protein 4
VAVGTALAATASKKDGAAAGGSGGRNLYLAKEGAIEPGSAAWEALSPADRALRARAAAETRTKLKSPNFAVSRTRLCLRNLPFSVDEASLKPLLLKAVTDRASKAAPRLVQVKVLRDGGPAGGDKKGAGAAAAAAAAGAAKSRGMAFAEFTEHEHALCALRQLNNSPVAFGPERRPVVEFAVDDARALHKRACAAAAREAATATAKAAAKEAKAAGGDKDGAPTKKSRAARRKERKLREEATAAEEDGGGGGEAANPDRPTKRPRRGRDSDDAPAPASPAPRQRKTAGADAAAAAAPPDTRRQPLKKNKKRAGGGEEVTDRTDDLVGRYEAKLFAAAGGGGGASALDRWL